MRIAYCEDEAAQAQLVRTMIEQWAECRQESAEVVLFESAEEFLFKNDDFPYDIVFLDIAMRQINGVELARTIRKKDKKLPIAFLTADYTAFWTIFMTNVLLHTRINYCKMRLMKCIISISQCEAGAMIITIICSRLRHI